MHKQSQITSELTSQRSELRLSRSAAVAPSDRRLILRRLADQTLRLRERDIRGSRAIAL